ncbi:glycosyltransferase [Thermodesulfobacteriota bacterium]
MGHEGIVIAADLHTSQEETRLIEGIAFHSIPLSVTSFFSFWKKAQLILQEFRPELLLASSDSYFGYLGMRLAKQLNIPFIFDVYDNYTAFGTNKIPGMKSLFFKTVRNADLVITAGKSLHDFLKQNAKSIKSVENGYAPTLFHPIPQNEAKSKLGILAKEKVIGYFGSLEPDLGIEDLIEAVQLLKHEFPDIHLMIAGRNKLHIDFKTHNIDYRGFLPQEKIPLLINACDVVVIPYTPSRMKQWCNACKIAEYVACNRPVVVTDIADHASIFSTVPQSLCEPGNPSSMANAIRAQLISPKILSNDGNHTWKKLTDKLYAEMESLLKLSNKPY